MIFKSKTVFIVIKKYSAQKFSHVVSIMSWRFVNSFVISLDWTTHLNLNFVFKSFRCSKEDIWDAFCLQLDDAWWWSYGKLTQKIWRMNLWRYGELFSVFTFRSVRLTCNYTFIYTGFLKCMMIPLILWAYKVGV